MKVNQAINNSVQNAGIGKTQGTPTAKENKAADAAKKAAQATTIPGSVNADISTKGKDMAADMIKAKNVASSTPDVREEKVAELKRRIAAGKYNIDADAVADRMVDDHMKMQGT